MGNDRHPGTRSTGVEPRKPSGRRRAFPGEEHLRTRPGSPFWHYDFSLDGRRFRGSCGTADLAHAAAFAHQQHDREWRRLRLGERPPSSLTLNEAFTGWWRDRGEGTRYGVQGQRHQLARIIRILGGSTRLDDLDNGTVARLVRGLRAGEGATAGQESRAAVSPATINRYLTTLSVVCRWAREVEGAAVGTWQKKVHAQAEPEGKERFLRREEAAALAREIVPHARAPIALALLTGLRRQNWLGLQWEQVSLDLRRAVMVGKGGRPIGVALSAQAVRLLETLQPDPALRRGPVFLYGQVPCPCAHCASPLYRGQPIRSIRRSFKTAARAAGVPDARIHDLRHTFASWLLEATGDLRLVGDALHHRQVTTTARYARLMPGRLESGVEAVGASLEIAALLPQCKKGDAA
jgi:integrase